MRGRMDARTAPCRSRWPRSQRRRLVLAGDRDVVLGPPLASVGRVGAGQSATPFGTHRAIVHDQLRRTAAQEADQQSVQAVQQVRASLPRQGAPQRRAAGPVLCRARAPPRRAVAQGRQYPHRLRPRVTSPRPARRVTPRHRPRDHLQHTSVHGCPLPQTTAHGTASETGHQRAQSPSRSVETAPKVSRNKEGRCWSDSRRFRVQRRRPNEPSW